MRIVAIARLLDGRKLIGIRLLDVNKGKVINATINSLRGMTFRGVHIENLDITEEKIVFKDGRLDRLTGVDKNGGVKNVSLLILHKIGNNKYCISDYTGNTRNVTLEDIIEYNKNMSIANGKIVERNGKKRLSALKGTFIDYGYEDGKYNGTYIRESRFKKVVISDSNGSIKEYRIGRDSIKSREVKPKLARKDDVKAIKIGDRRLGLLDDTVGLNDILIENKFKNKEELESLLCSNKVINKMNAVILNGNTKIRENKLDYKYNDELDVYEVDNEFIYNKIIVNANLTTDSLDDYSTFNMEHLSFNKERLKAIKSKIYLNIRSVSINYDYIILKREVTEEGIWYIVANRNNEMIRIELHKILLNIDEFINISRDEVRGIITIESIDGVYEYKIDDMYNRYQGRLLESSNRRVRKAKVLGDDYREKVDEHGNLIEISNFGDDLIIPKDVKNIKPMAIRILNRNRRIVIGKNVQNISDSAFCITNGGMDDKDNGFDGLEEIIFDNTIEVLEELIVSLMNTDMVIAKDGLKIIYKRELECEEAIKAMLIASELYINIDMSIKDCNVNSIIDYLENKVLGFKVGDKIIDYNNIAYAGDKFNWNSEENKIWIRKADNIVIHEGLREKGCKKNDIRNLIEINEGSLRKNGIYNELKHWIESIDAYIEECLKELESRTKCRYV